MAYSTSAELIQHTGSAYGATIDAALIAQGDREIDAELARFGLTGSGEIIHAASLKLAVKWFMVRRRTDGGQPGTIKMGDLELSDDIDTAIQQLQDSAMEDVRKFVDVNQTGGIERRYYIGISNKH